MRTLVLMLSKFCLFVFFFLYFNSFTLLGQTFTCNQPNNPCALIPNSSLATSCSEAYTPFINCVNYWTSSHGTPQLNQYSPQYSPSTNHASMWTHAFTDGNNEIQSRGEGIAVGIPRLTTGNSYTLSFFKKIFTDNSWGAPDIDNYYFVLLTCAQFDNLRLYGENYNIPSIPAGAQIIYQESNANNFGWQSVTEVFTANAQYEVLWIFPKNNTVYTIGETLWAWLEIALPQIKDNCNCTAPPPPPELVTVNIPIRHSNNLQKQDPAYGRSCSNETFFHSHWQYSNHCDNRMLMSAYMEGDNSSPIYDAIAIDFMMIPYNYSFTMSYLDFVGHNLAIYEPCFRNDIVSANLKLFHQEPPYCLWRNGWLTCYKSINQSHSGDNAFSIKRITQRLADGCYSGSIYPINSPQFTYDNLFATTNEIINVPATTNPFQDYSINVTSMLQNAVVPQSNYIGFLIKQVQTSTYNNVLFKGNQNYNAIADEGEPYLQLTYWRRTKANNCDPTFSPDFKNGIFEEKSLFTSNNLQIKQIKGSIDVFEGIQIYPNPAQTNVSIKSEYPITLLQITSLSNQKVKELKFINLKLISVNISDLKAGVYNCTITTKNGTTNQKLIIQR